MRSRPLHPSAYGPAADPTDTQFPAVLQSVVLCRMSAFFVKSGGTISLNFLSKIIARLLSVKTKVKLKAKRSYSKMRFFGQSKTILQDLRD